MVPRDCNYRTPRVRNSTLDGSIRLQREDAKRNQGFTVLIAMTNNPKNRNFDRQTKSEQDVSPAGPHDMPELTDDRKTPGSGVLPDKDSKEVEGPTG